jgi:hypothetical protein
VSVTLSDGAGSSPATAVAITKESVPPIIQVSLPAYVNNVNVSSYSMTAFAQPGSSLSCTITDVGNTTISGSRSSVPASGKWNANPSLSTLKDGLLTLVFTELDPAGNTSTNTIYVTKSTVAPSAPTIALSPSSDSGVSSTDYITKINNPVFTTTAAASSIVTVYVNGAVYTGQHLPDGSYTVTATATDVYGNGSATATAPKTLVIVTSPPTGSFTVAGAKTYNGVLYTNSTTPSLSLSFTDPSGVDQVAVSVNGGTSYGAWQTYATTVPAGTLANGDGSYTIFVELKDVAGNISVGTYSLTVQLRTAGPTISASLSTAPATVVYNNQTINSYDGTGNVTISSSATDPTTVSSLTTTLDSAAFSGTTVNTYTLTAGTHTLVITATDGLGNTSSTTLTFAIHPSLTGLVDAVNYGYSTGAMTSGEQSTLLGYLKAQTKANLNSFITACKSASTKTLTAAESTILQNWANDLLSRTTV